MTDPLIGKILNGAYRIESVLADGGMGLVYIAEQLSLGRKIVLKVLRPGCTDDDFIDLFLREARINSQLNHPNVVSIFDFGKAEDGTVFLAMEYLDGQTIGDIVKAQQGLSLAKCLWVMEQICSSMHAAHKMQIVHRDIKPNNIMVSSVSGDTLVAKILDFGISKPLAEQDLKHTRMGMVMGTPGYISPEQISGDREIDIRADVYSLGALLYFMITGEAPYQGTSGEVVMHKQLSSLPEPLDKSVIQDAEAAVLQSVIAKAMQLEPEQRYQDVSSFWNDIVESAKKRHSTDSVGEGHKQEATRYNFIYQGDKTENSTEEELKLNLQKNHDYNAKQITTLLSGRRVVVRKNLNYEEAKKLAAKFQASGAIGKIEPMHDATRIVTRSSRESNTLPSPSLLEAISLGDIQAAAAKAELDNQDDVNGNAPPATNSQSFSASLHFNNSQISSQSSSVKPSRSNKKNRLLVISTVCLGVLLGSLWLFIPLRYQLLDFYHYTILREPVPRGVDGNNIEIGMSAALSGSAREIGHSMRTGINTYFKYINQQGGVNGRQLTLMELDDGYEPSRALTNVKTFLDPGNGVFALLGNVGTPTAKAILPTLLNNSTIVFGTFSGSSILRNNPPDRYVFNYRASYDEETSALINYYVNELEIPAERVAVLYQNDSFGLAGLRGVETALHKHGISHDAIIKASYERNTSQVTQAVDTFSVTERPIEAFILVSTYAASAEFIKQMKQSGFTGKFANLSFVGSSALAERLQEIGIPGEGVLISQVVPPYSSYATGVLKYREHLTAYYPGEAPNFISLEGYIIAEIFCEALRRSGRYFDTEKIVEALETLENFDLGIGTPISFSLSNHQGSHRVWGTMIDKNGQFVSVDLVTQ